MEHKTAHFELKAPGSGRFRCVFSTFNTVDHQGDVTLPGAFEPRAAATVSAFQHASWQGELPVGEGVIESDREKAWLDGEFWLETRGGNSHYEVCSRSSLMEWSYGFDVVDASTDRAELAKFPGAVRILKKVKVYEVSPVLVGAGIGTHTEYVKGTASHSALGRDPEMQRIRGAVLRRQSKRVSARLESAKLRTQWKALQERTYLHVLPDRVHPETRLIAEGVAKIAAAELGVPVPRLKFFTPATPTDARAAASLGSSMLETFDGFRIPSRVRGIAHPERNEIKVDARLSGWELRYVVAHEVKHLDEDNSETAAERYGQDFADRYSAA